MPQFDLHAVHEHGSSHLDSFEAGDLDEAIGLSMIRLEHRDIELRSKGNIVARLSKDGRLIRMDGQQGSHSQAA